jgi:AraC-like DNA-binding protein
MSFNPHPGNPTPEQISVINAVNTAPKALLHLCIDPKKGLYTAPELNTAFMELQGANPVWQVSKNYAMSMASGKPAEAGTISISDTYPVVGMTDKGIHVGVPVAAHLLVIADTFGIKQTVLAGESVQRADGNSPIELRYRAARFMVDLGLKETFTNKDLAEALRCSPSAASTIITEFSSAPVGFLDTDPSTKPIRNSYARYDVVSLGSETTPEIDDELSGQILDVLPKLEGQTIDAIIVAKELGYNIKYAGKDIADFLEVLERNGQLKTVVSSLERSRMLRTSKRGLHATQSLLSVYESIENPSAEFKRRGTKLAKILRQDQEAVKRIITRTPAKRGQKKLDSPAHIREVPAAEHVASLLTDRHVSTQEIQAKLGISRTAAARILRQAFELGLASRQKHGRELIWARAN